MTPEAVMSNVKGPQMSQEPAIDFATPPPNTSTPSGSTFSAPPEVLQDVEAPSLTERLNQRVQGIQQRLSEFEETEEGQLLKNIQELQTKFGGGKNKGAMVSNPDRGAADPIIVPDEPIPLVSPREIPQLSPVETTPFQSDSGLGLSDARSSAIQNLLVDLKLNRRSFG